jgi:uncharacterized membrane protein YozB (DUF420 family)
MYGFVLITHSWLRYVVLALGVLLIALALNEMRSRASWSARNTRVHKAFLSALDTQFLLGVLLYLWLSPLTSAAFADFGAAMKNAQLRFFGLEHAVTMFLAVAVAHVGKVRAYKRPEAERARTVLVFQLIWLALTCAAIPWPVLDVGRPLFRM